MRTSVIIASYNYGRFLEEAVRSVQEQTVDDLEIIVVDDGSTDDTPEVLSRIREPRLRAHRIPNSGVSVARNTAMRLARGEFIAFLDADDRWKPTKLERQVAMMESEPELGFIFTNLTRFTEEGPLPGAQFDFNPGLPRVPTRASRDGGGRVITADTFSSLVLHHLPTWPSTVMVRAAMVRGIEFPPRVRICEDLHYFMRIAPHVQAGYITEPLAELRRHRDNSYSTMREVVEGALGAYGRIQDEPLSEEHRAVLQRRIGGALVELAYAHFHGGNPRASAGAALRALRYRGNRTRAVKQLALLPLMPLLADLSNVDWSLPTTDGS
jgi:glycosyltransferase involved in cell wall biosynthesis